MQHTIVYTKKEIQDIANKYPNRSEFRKHDWIAFIQAKENGWLNEISPKKLEVMTYEKAYNIASSYDDYSSFRCNEFSAYGKAIKEGWVKDYPWLTRGNRDMYAKINIVYAYIFKQYNSVYIGRTINPTVRYWAHLHYEKDSVYQFMFKNHLKEKDFEYIVIEDNLNAYESADKECFYMEQYKDNGWLLINKAKGGSLGTMKEFWTEDKCYELARQFEYLKDFADAYPGAYAKACTRKWNSKYTWLIKFKPKHMYSYQECWDKARLCTSMFMFCRDYPSYKSFSKRKDWIKDYTWLEIQKHDSVIEYDLNGDFVTEHEHISIEFGKDATNIIKCAKGQHKYHKNKIWKYKADVLDENGNILQHIEVNLNHSYFKPIVQYTKEGNYIREYDYINQTGYNDTTIGEACKGIKTIYAFGYLWRYKSDVLDENGNVLQHVEARENQCNKTLIQYDVEGNYIAEFENQTKAIKSGHKRGAIEWTANYKFDDRLFKYNEIWLLKKDVLKQFGKIPMKIDVKETLSVLSNMIL